MIISKRRLESLFLEGERIIPHGIIHMAARLIYHNQ